MRPQLKNSLLTLTAVIVLAGLLSGAGCRDWGTVSPGPNTPGSINGTLNLHVGGTTSTNCTAPAVTWAASSPAGSQQTKTSPAIAQTDNVSSVCETYNFEGTEYTSCSCPVKQSFSSLAPGTWTIQADGVSCSVKVNPGQTSQVTLYTDGRSCATAP